jgi:ribosomal protein S18 acetylase RimI-like enzyme
VVKIREASRTDVDVVVDLIAAMGQEMASYSNRGLKGEDRVRSLLRGRFAESYEKRRHAYLVASVGDPEELAGIVEISLVSADGVFSTRLVLHIHSLYVRPCYRHRGIGRTLLEEALVWGREQGCVEAELSVLAQNPARELYERMGFEVSELEMRLEL